MELVWFAMEVLENVAEHAASYRLGQSALRQLHRALWVVEKCARWAVPPPLDADEGPQPELVRPLPWVFFLALLVTLRITRESISLVNLVMGKPPLRSADVVTYIQSKRRYLRTLKYQGSRLSRARATSSQPQRAWYARVHSLFEFTMCFRRNSRNYGNNNTTSISNNDEVLVVKRNKHTRQPSPPAALSSGESTMERLIEKMMVDLDADSDDDSSFTLTNVTSIRSDRSDTGDSADSEQETVLHDTSAPAPAPAPAPAAAPCTEHTSPPRRSSEIDFAPNRSAVSTPERTDSPQYDFGGDLSEIQKDKTYTTEEAESATEDDMRNDTESRKLMSPKRETRMLLQSEKSTISPKTDRSIGREPLKTWSVIAITQSILRHKHAKLQQIGVNGDRRDSDVSVAKTKSTDKTM